MADVKFTTDHEWLQIEGDEVTIGITNYAQEQLGDLVFVDLPDVGKAAAQGDEIAVVESVKAASEVYAPVSGDVIAVNDALEGDPSLINNDAEGEGWIFKMKLSDPGEVDDLMDEAAYKDHLSSLD